LQQGELSMVCVGLSERDLKNFGGAIGGARQNLGGKWPPWHPPSSAPVDVFKRESKLMQKTCKMEKLCNCICCRATLLK